MLRYNLTWGARDFFRVCGRTQKEISDVFVGRFCETQQTAEEVAL